MFANLRGIIIKHIGIIIISIVIIVAGYFLLTEVILKTSDSTAEAFSVISDVLDSNTSTFYNDTILTGSQVITTIEKYYDKSDMMLLLLNNPKDYNNASYRFWVTGKGGKYGQNTNYESIIISNDYEDVTHLLVQEKSINNKYSKYTKQTLESYSDINSKNYIRLSGKYKSVLLKCNGYIVGIALFAI